MIPLFSPPPGTAAYKTNGGRPLTTVTRSSGGGGSGGEATTTTTTAAGTHTVYVAFYCEKEDVNIKSSGCLMKVVRQFSWPFDHVALLTKINQKTGECECINISQALMMVIFTHFVDA
jgi:hypothetical protein